jgi:hypothetical protein
MLKIVPKANQLQKEPADDVRCELWRSITGIDDRAGNKERMFEVEFAQVVARSRKMEVSRAIDRRAHRGRKRAYLRELVELASEEADVSLALRQRVADI